MESMTEEEAFALDEHYTSNPPKVDITKARIRIPMIRIDNTTAEYLTQEAKISQKKPEEIIGNLVREKLAEAHTYSFAPPRLCEKKIRKIKTTENTEEEFLSLTTRAAINSVKREE